MPRDSNCNPSINCMQIYINNEIYWQKDANARARKHYQNGIFFNSFAIICSAYNCLYCSAMLPGAA